MSNFNCTGGAATYTVPAGVNSLRVYATGGAGAPSRSGATDAAAGQLCLAWCP